MRADTVMPSVSREAIRNHNIHLLACQPKMRHFKANGTPFDIIVEESSHPSAASTKQIKNAAKEAEAAPRAISLSITTEERTQLESTTRNEDSSRASLEVKEKTKKDEKKKDRRIKVVGFRDESSRKSAQAFKKAPPTKKLSKAPTKSRSFFGGYRKDASKTQKDGDDLREIAKETLSLTENVQETLSMQQNEEDLRYEDEVSVEQAMADDLSCMSRYGNKSTHSEVTSVSHQNEQDEKSVASTGSQMMKGRTSFDTEAGLWATVTEFPRRLYQEGEKDRTAIPAFVARSVVNDVFDTIVYLSTEEGRTFADDDTLTLAHSKAEEEKTQEEQGSTLLNTSDVMALVQYVSGNRTEQELKGSLEKPKGKDQYSIKELKVSDEASVSMFGIEVTEDDYAKC